MTDAPLIEIEGLRITFHSDDGRTTHAVDRVDLSLAHGATLGLVGESGCGKSVTSLAIMGLLSKHSAEVTGSIRFDGFDLLEVPDQTLRDLRGNRMAMIFQEPMTSLNPMLHHRQPDHRGHPASSRRVAAPGARARHRAVAARPHPLAGAANRRISAQAVGRNAPARHDRDGAGLRSDAADRRRAHHRARRDPAGRDSRADARAESGQRCGDHSDHPRPRRGRRSLRRGRGDVCRRDRRTRRRRCSCSPPPSIPTPLACSARSRGSTARRRVLPPSPAWFPTCRGRRPAAASPRAAPSSAKSASLRRRRCGRSGRITGRAASRRRSKGWYRDRPARGRRTDKIFRRRSFAVRTADRLGQGGRRDQLSPRRRPDAGAGRRIRLRQIDREPAGAPADRAGCRQVRFEGRDLLALNASQLRGFRSGCPDHLPGPLRLAQPAHDRQPDPERTAGAARSRAARRAVANGSPNCCIWSGWSRASRAATLTNFPAASASASPLRARWRSNRN